MRETLSARQTVYRGRALTLHVDRVLLSPDGREATREVVEHAGSVVLIAVDDAGHLLLVRQFRYAIGTELLELPAGTLEPGELPVEAAHRELAEETGQHAGSLELLAELYPSPGYTNERMWLFLATELSEAPSSAPDDDEDIVVEPVDFAGALARARAGEFDDMKTVAGILLAEERMARSRAL